MCVCTYAHMCVCEGEWDAGTLKEVELDTEWVFTVPHPFWALLCPCASFESHPSGHSTQDVILLATKMILTNTVCLRAMRPINKEVQLYFSFILSTYLQVQMSLRFITTSTILTASASSTCLSLQTFLGSKGASLAVSVKKSMRVSVLSLRVHPEAVRDRVSEHTPQWPMYHKTSQRLSRGSSPSDDHGHSLIYVSHFSLFHLITSIPLRLCRTISQINHLQPSPKFQELLGGKPKLWQEPFSVMKGFHKGIALWYG